MLPHHWVRFDNLSTGLTADLMLMSLKTYQEQLNDPRWQKRKLERYSASDYTCQECGCKTEQLNLHHYEYFKGRMIWEYTDDELVLLCKSCHQELHKYKSELFGVINHMMPHTLREALDLINSSEPFINAVSKALKTHRGLERIEDFCRLIYFADNNGEGK